jgi:hypothetical protein
VFDGVACLHDHGLLTQLADHGQVVSDEEEGDRGGVPEVGQEVEDLGLDRDVERCDGLVQEQDVRFHDQRPCSGGALALAAREMCRPGGLLAREADSLQEFG